MAKPISYADAVRMLGDEPVVTALNDVFGGALLSAATLGLSDALSWFDPKPDAVRLGHKLVGGLRDKITGLGRHDRTRRLQAAHAIIVLTAFYEAIDEIGLPFSAKEIELGPEDLVAIATVENASGVLASSLLHHGLPVPQAHRPYEEALESLRAYYAEIGTDLLGHLHGLAVWWNLDATRRDRALRTLQGGLADAALARYEVLYRQLAVDFPEFAFWAGLGQHRATREELRTGLAELSRLLTGLTPGRVPDHQLTALTLANEAALGRPVTESAEQLDGLTFPTLGSAYIDPGFKVADAPDGADLGTEERWETLRVRDDLPLFLAGHLTSSRAVEAPLVVLGQPGAGKSVLVKVLAARLGAEGFLPVRVPLRSVSADAQIQEQIEQAVHSATGERLSWPDLARSGGGALPVVLLDGLDELLQATGVQRADYLVQVADFQRREAELGRPVAVVVTTRTAVADRCRLPAGTLAVRLEPFDDGRVERWLRVWNAANAGYFASRGLRPLSAEAAAAHRELAGQPLLLLMLALYDAHPDSNGVLDGEGMSGAELYERLLVRFAGREVDKHHAGLAPRERGRAVEHELLRLSVTAFAMFNRGRQWVTAEELDADLAALLPGPPPAAPAGFQAALSQADLAVGSFFFVHRSQAVRDRRELRTYEFLHATFGEYLVARLLHRVLADLADQEERASPLLGGSGPVDGLLHALTSFTVLTTRPPVLDFLAQLAGGDDRLKPLLIRLFQAREERTDRSYEAYRPVPGLSVIARHACYGANLVLLAVHLSGDLRVSELCRPGEDPVRLWRSLAPLWRAALTSEQWQGTVGGLAAVRMYDDGLRDLRLLSGRGSASDTVDLAWTLDLGEDGVYYDIAYLEPADLRASTGLLCLPEVDLFVALSDAFDDGDALLQSLGAFEAPGGSTVTSMAAALIRVLMASRIEDAEELSRIYRAACSIATRPSHAHLDSTLPVILSRLEQDLPRLPRETSIEILEGLAPFRDRCAAPFVRCALALTARHQVYAQAERWLRLEEAVSPLVALLTVTTVIELGPDMDPENIASQAFRAVREFDAADLLMVHHEDPQLYHRAMKIITAYGEPYGLAHLEWQDMLNPHA
ncbi:NACHT domain-containing protein [Planomonospora corallina]|uniref:NACHT domain-containing protein n=1 Tax=Planomonospora corallina TaxID=1806052 RepID=A0ABV8I551_9ACTN